MVNILVYFLTDTFFFFFKSLLGTSSFYICFKNDLFYLNQFSGLLD